MPWPWRWLLARRPELVRGVLAVLIREITRWYQDCTDVRGQTGSVTVTQRFGSASNLNFHFHALMLDGVYARGDVDTVPALDYTPVPTQIPRLPLPDAHVGDGSGPKILQEGLEMLLLIAIGQALATTWAPPPPTMTEQISAADLAGEFEIVAVKTVLFEGVHATSHVELAPLSTVDGSLDHVTLVLPGAYVDGSFRTNGKDSFPVSMGERLLLTLTEVSVASAVQQANADGTPVRVFNTSGSFNTSVLRATADGARTIAHDATGRAVVSIPCDGRMMHAVAIENDPAEAAMENLVYVDSPDALALDWDTAVADFLYCGGAL